MLPTYGQEGTLNPWQLDVEGKQVTEAVTGSSQADFKFDSWDIGRLDLVPRRAADRVQLR